jgi:hypothetical protein
MPSLWDVGVAIGAAVTRSDRVWRMRIRDRFAFILRTAGVHAINPINLQLKVDLLLLMSLAKSPITSL